MTVETRGTTHESAPLGCRFVLRVGTDIQSIASVAESIERHGRRYLDRMFTAHEVECCGGYDAEPKLLAPGLTARFCAKEAVLKALRPLTITPEWRDMEIVRMPGGWVRVELTRRARQLAEESGLTDLEVSISHGDEVAIASAVAMGWLADDLQRVPATNALQTELTETGGHRNGTTNQNGA